MEKEPDATLNDIYKLQENIIERLERIEKRLFQVEKAANPPKEEGPVDSRFFSF